MPLFGKKKTQNMAMPEVVDFSNDTWSFKGEAPVYQIQSDGFTYDIPDSDGNDKNAISLGIAGMLIIVLNAKSPKIREDELLPHLGKVIKTRNWHSMSVKDANFLAQTASKKLTSSATSSDVFDLASYAPLEVKRVLLKTLFTISRTQMKPEFREEAEHRVIDDIVPAIFANPEYELALLTGLIVKPDKQQVPEPVPQKVDTSSVLGTSMNDSYYRSASSDLSSVQAAPVEPDSAFAELQKIYGRTADTVRTSLDAIRAAETQQPQQPSAPDKPSAQEEPKSRQTGSMPVFGSVPQNNPFAQSESNNVSQQAAPNFGTPQPANPFAQAETNNISQQAAPNFGTPQPNNPFAQAEPKNIPQPGVPNFGSPQPNMPFYGQQGNAVPQPPMPNFGQMPASPFMNQSGNPQFQTPGYMQTPPYPGNLPQYPGQMRPQNPQMMQNPQNPQNPNLSQQSYPGQVPPQNPAGYPNGFNMPQYCDGQQTPYNPGWMNRPQNYPQQPQTNDPTTAENA